MPKYSVDIKAFISVEVEATNRASARFAAEDYVTESLSPDELEIKAWNGVMEDEDGTTEILGAGCWDIDGVSEVERLDEEEEDV